MKHANDYLPYPYPGERPTTSYVIDTEGTVLALEAAPELMSGWAVCYHAFRVDLDEWLVSRGAPTLKERVPLLSYGSNGCPAKMLSNRVGLPSVNILCRTDGLAAVWSAGTRSEQGDVPATLAVHPGLVEEQFLSYVTPSDFRALDAVEGRAKHWYDLCAVTAGQVVRDDGLRVADAVAYVGARPERWPALAEDGDPVLVRRTGVSAMDAQQEAAALVAHHVVTRRPAPVGPPVNGVPVAPTPDHVFVYGTLMPGQGRWPALRPHATGHRTAQVLGALFDTGHGWPAAFPSAESMVPGWLITVATDRVSDVLAELDTIEGTKSGLFRREQRVVDSQLAWVYFGADSRLRVAPIDCWDARMRASSSAARQR